ncbi:MAG TPA: PPE family protein [Mycobacterium sp.]
MTAPIWIAFPPEVHSTLLSSGPGSGPLLAAAATWSSMSAEYVSAADELTGLLGAAQGSAWQGPSAEQYVAAHAPYLGWLHESSAKSAAAATLHETAATAYTAALAAMPTLPELAANHAIHGALLATNFFGVNTIPIAVNEADYARMWLQAAETMTTYQVVTESAMAAVPATTPAPTIVTPAAEVTVAATQASATATDSGSTSWQDQLEALIRWYTTNFAWPVSKDLNPNGWPFNPIPFVNGIQSFLSAIPGFSPTLANAIAWATFHTLMIFWPFIQLAIQMAVVLAPVVVAAVGAAAAGGAAAAVTAVSIAVPLSGAPAPAVAPVAAPMGATPAPAIGTASAPTTVSNAPTVSSATAPTATAPASGGIVGGGPGGGFGPTATDGVGAGMSDWLYAVGLSGLAARGSTGNRARRKSKEPASDDVDVPAGAAAAAGAKRARARRRRAATDHAYRFEYMDSDQELLPGFDNEDPHAARPSGEGAGPLGFAGAATEPGVSQATGLTTITGDGLSDWPVTPMMPSSWGRD